MGKRRIDTRILILAIIIVVVVAGVTVAGWILPSGEGYALTDINGNTFRLSDFRGKVVIIDFMATWCPPCREEISHLRAIGERYGDQVVIISVGVDPNESRETLKRFADNFNITWRIAPCPTDMVEDYSIKFLPTLVILDGNGDTRFTHVGLTDEATLIPEIDQLIGG